MFAKMSCSGAADATAKLISLFHPSDVILHDEEAGWTHSDGGRRVNPGLHRHTHAPWAIPISVRIGLCREEHLLLQVWDSGVLTAVVAQVTKVYFW